MGCFVLQLIFTNTYWPFRNGPQKSRLMISNTSDALGCDINSCQSCDAVTDLQEVQRPLNIIDTTKMLLTIKISCAIPYVTGSFLADMALHLNTSILISNGIYTFYHSRTRYFWFIFFFRWYSRTMINMGQMLWHNITWYIERLTFDFILYFDQLKV